MTMFVESVGQGPAIVLLHGWAMHGGIFAPLVPRLAASHTVHAVDLPGHGRSGRDARLDLAAIGDELADRYAGATLVGWSLGGLAALDAVVRRPHAFAGLGAIATSPRFVVADGWPHGVAHDVFETFGRELATDYARTLDRFLGLECVGSDHARSDLRELRARAFEHGPPAAHVLDDGLRILADTDHRASLATLAVPSVWIAGARDRLVTPAALEWAASAAPNARYAKIAGGGHAPFIAHPDAVLAALAPLLGDA